MNRLEDFISFIVEKLGSESVIKIISINKCPYCEKCRYKELCKRKCD